MDGMAMMRFGLGLMSAVLATLWANVWSVAWAGAPNFAAQPSALETAQRRSQSPPQWQLAKNPQRTHQSGTKMIVNGIRVAMPWVAWSGQDAAAPKTFAISDVGLRQLGGIDLLNTDNPKQQPILWRNTPLQENGQFLELSARLMGQHRYLDLQPLVEEAGWQVTLADTGRESGILKIQTRSILQISNLLLGRALGNVFGPHDIAWADGVRWKQDFVRVGGAEFPVTQLRLNLKQQGLSLQPVWPEGDGLVGISRLGPTLADRAAIAGINGGFFNRNNKTPLGALRNQGDWLSGPILNRGVMGWNDAGQVVMDRLTLTETLRTPTDTFESIALNSGYLKAGFSRYTKAWGPTYVPLTDNEVLIYVQEAQGQQGAVSQGKVVRQVPTGKAGIGSFSLEIPNGQPGYVLVARSNRSGAAKLPVGTLIERSQRWSSASLERSPHIVGAGPLLIQNQRIVLDAKAEGFSKAFIREQAPRSAAVVFRDGSLSLVTVHERIGGRGPTLSELVRLLQSLGAVQALNLDGGSSTQLLLGGQMVNRPPRSAARVHSGIGLFFR